MQALAADPITADPGFPRVDPRQVSPELALVDPELAAYARAHLPLGPVWSPPARPTAEPVARSPRVAPAAERIRGVHVWRSRALVAAVGVSLFALGFAAMLGVLRVERTNDPAARAAAPVPDGAARLAWAPVPGAHAYRIRVSDGSQVVVDRLVSKPSLFTTLRRGSYRWTVRAIGGSRDGALVVDSSMTVAASS